MPEHTFCLSRDRYSRRIPSENLGQMHFNHQNFERLFPGFWNYPVEETEMRTGEKSFKNNGHFNLLLNR